MKARQQHLLETSDASEIYLVYNVICYPKQVSGTK